ncbi:DUF4387 domain-containing protein [Desulfospira joergensenii]|uniref:DUF4387 domain-containing protein n=1 Tax=Desulfospira joergensenii TaxID=53329 RepID=UPI0003B77C0A|nr:DUF4387 domain-containing protein [Desulfospira joergensenii]
MKLKDMARVIRSKNAGPFLLTLDILFKERTLYEEFKESGLVTRETAARLYGVPVDEIESVIFFEPAHALKITLRRPVVSGGHGDTDIYGAQQHIPLMNWEFDL